MKRERTALKTYKKIGGGSFRLYNGKIVKQNEIFKCNPNQIPKAFVDLLVEVDGSEEPAPKVVEEVIAKDTPKADESAVDSTKNADEAVETDVDAPFYLQDMGGGWWTIVNRENKKVVVDKNLRKAKADELLAELLA